MSAKPNKEVYVVTTLGISPEAELKKRMRNYSLVMIIRTLSILLLFLVPLPYNLLFILIGVFAPIIAVVYANNQNPGINNGLEKPNLELEGTEVIKREEL
jgi:1,4-dihydroxy-2-naphthoate octaprenyltransferase